MEGTTLTTALAAIAALLTTLSGALIWVVKHLLTATLPDLAGKGIAELQAERATNREQFKEERAANREQMRMERESCERRHADVMTIIRSGEVAAQARHEQVRAENKEVRHRIGGLDSGMAAILDRLRVERPAGPPPEGR